MAFSAIPRSWLGVGIRTSRWSSRFYLDGTTNLLGSSTVKGLVDGDMVVFREVTGTLPGELALNKVYYVRDYAEIGGVGCQFKIAATLGGTAINFTDTGAYVHLTEPDSLKLTLGESGITGLGTAQKVLDNLTEAEANPLTGDIRKIMFEVVDAFRRHWESFAVTDLPTKVQLESDLHVVEGGLRRQIQMEFDLNLTAGDVRDE